MNTEINSKNKSLTPAQKTAKIHNVSTAYVSMVVNGVRENDAILKTYRSIIAGAEMGANMAANIAEMNIKSNR